MSVTEKWSGYLEKNKIPMDGWGRPFHYKHTPNEEHEYELWSKGSLSGKEKGKKIDVWE